MAETNTSTSKSWRPRKFSFPRDRQRPAAIALLILACLAAGFLGGYFGNKSRSVSSNSGFQTTANREVILNESQLISDIARNVGPSVVSVNVVSQGTAMDFFGYDQPIEQESAGTGFILNEDGVVITNRHVVPEGSGSVSVTLSDGTELSDVEVIGRTAETDSLDVAFLRIKDKKGKTLTPVRLGDSAKMQVGDKVVAIGNALGQFQNTVTEGIISGYGRNLEAYDSEGGAGETLQNMFQTDAAINQGNSGGPLVNINGEVIAINTAVAAGGAENIGFAIPISDVQGLITSVLEKGQLLRPYLGVRYINLTDDIAYQLNLETKRGAYIAPSSRGSSIVAGSPAEKAGLREKDIITKVDGQAIDDKSSLTSVLGRHEVGDEVSLTIIRDNKEETIKTTLEAAPSS